MPLAVDFIRANANKQKALRLMRKFESSKGRWPETKRAASLADKYELKAKKMINKQRNKK